MTKYPSLKIYNSQNEHLQENSYIIIAFFQSVQENEHALHSVHKLISWNIAKLNII